MQDIYTIIFQLIPEARGSDKFFEKLNTKIQLHCDP